MNTAHFDAGYLQANRERIEKLRKQFRAAERKAWAAAIKRHLNVRDGEDA